MLWVILVYAILVFMAIIWVGAQEDKAERYDETDDYYRRKEWWGM